MTKFAGITATRLPSSSYVARPVSAPISWKLPASSNDVDPLPDGELAVGVMAVDLLLAAHLLGEGRAARQLLELRLPGHAADPT